MTKPRLPRRPARSGRHRPAANGQIAAANALSDIYQTVDFFTPIALGHVMIVNLHLAALHHKKACNESCNVSLFLLKRAAEVLFYEANANHELTHSEVCDIQERLGAWPR